MAKRKARGKSQKKSLLARALEGATPAQLLSIRDYIERVDQTSVGFFIFYAEDALRPFDRGNYDHPEIRRAVGVIGMDIVTEILRS